jgi:hypothetical protein
MMRAISCRQLTALVLCLAVAPTASAQDKDAAFRRGLDARGDKRWQEVVTQLRTAIQGDSRESTRKVGRRVLGIGQTEEYLPHFFLGEALFNLNDCAGAVEAWSVSEQQRVVTNRTELVKQMEEGYKVCSSKGVLPPREFTPLLASTRQRITDVTALAQQIRDQGQTQAELWTPQLNEHFERARVELVASNTRLTTATRARSAADFAEATAAADRAAGLLRSLDATLKAAIDNRTSVRGQTEAVKDLIGAAEAADRSLDTIGENLPPALAATRANARAMLTRSRESLQESVSTSNTASANEALKYAQDASGLFKQVLDQIKAGARQALEQRLGEALALATEAFSFVDASFATLDRLAAAKPDLVRPEMAGERDAAQKQLDALRRRFERARRGEDVAGIQEVARLTAEGRGRLDALIKSFGALTLRDRGVHASLEAGARAFFDGEYQAALTSLDRANTPTDVPLQVHVHLFRAAALYALYVRSNERDESLRMQALAEIERCKQLNPAFVPAATAFGPRFIDFFNQGGGQRSPAAGAAVANP